MLRVEKVGDQPRISRCAKWDIAHILLFNGFRPHIAAWLEKHPKVERVIYPRAMAGW